MSHFTFKAKKPSGEIYSGEKDVADRYELYKLLRENGEEVVSFNEKNNDGKGLHMNLSFKFSSKRIKMTERIHFARNLGSMLDAGLALSRALSVLERQARSVALKEVLTALMSEIDKGETFSAALAKHPKVFSPLFISMVHAGEQSGTLAESLKIVAAQMESSYSLERRIRGALIYPSVILCVMVLIGILMFVFVVPTLMKTFTELKVELPLSTRAVLFVSDLIQHQGLLVLMAVIALFTGFIYWKRTPAGTKIVQSAILKIPVIGLLVQEVNSARTARTLSSLLSSGVDVVESVKHVLADATRGAAQNPGRASRMIRDSSKGAGVLQYSAPAP
jgi:type IV pilus assembly protein PilC